MPAVGATWNDDDDGRRRPTYLKGALRWRLAPRRSPYRADWKRGRVAELADDRRPQADRDPLHRHEPRSSSSLGGMLSLFMRAQLATPNEHFVTRDRYNELFTIHGTTMVFLVVVPILAGFGNYLVPLMIGARDMAFPRLNAFSYWLFLLGGDRPLLELLRRRAGRRRPAGRRTPPLSENAVQPGERPGPLDPLAPPPRRSRRSRARSTSSRRSTTCARRDDLDAHAALRLVDRGLRRAARRDPAR